MPVFSEYAGSDDDSVPKPERSTTPSRLAIQVERAAAMHDALSKLPPELREVVRLRLFEELETAEVAKRLGIGLSAAKHLFRKGAILYERSLQDAFASSSSGKGVNPSSDLSSLEGSVQNGNSEGALRVGEVNDVDYKTQPEFRMESISVSVWMSLLAESKTRTLKNRSTFGRGFGTFPGRSNRPFASRAEMSTTRVKTTLSI